MYKFEGLIVWKKGLQLIKKVYVFTEKLTDFSLKDQTRRAVASICINIAEGSGSQNNKEFNRYLYISRKSLFEVAACLKIIKELYGIEDAHIDQDLVEVGKILNGLINKVKSEV